MNFKNLECLSDVDEAKKAHCVAPSFSLILRYEHSYYAYEVVKRDNGKTLMYRGSNFQDQQWELSRAREPWQADK